MGERFKDSPLLDEPNNRWLIKHTAPVAPYEDALAAATCYAYLTLPNDRDALCYQIPESLTLWNQLDEVASGSSPFTTEDATKAATILKSLRDQVERRTATAREHLAQAERRRDTANIDFLTEAIRILDAARDRATAVIDQLAPARSGASYPSKTSHPGECR